MSMSWIRDNLAWQVPVSYYLWHHISLVAPEDMHVLIP